MKLRPDLNNLKALLACLSIAALAACGGGNAGTSDPASDAAATDAPDTIETEASPDTVAGSAGGLPPPALLAAEPVAPPDVVTEPAPLSEADVAAAMALQGTDAAPTESATALATGVHCADEGGRCNFSGTQTVLYGAGSRTVSKTFSNGVTCSNAVFGDPAPGTRKSCSYTSAGSAPAPAPGPATSWVQCANEGGRCNFSGTQAVRYGAGSSTVTRTFSNGVTCSNAVFGDPAPGTPKTCSYGSESAAAAPPAPAPAPSPVPGPVASGGGTPTPSSIAGKRVVGRIDAASGQVIENVHVMNPNGPCVVVFQGRTNVTIRNSEIGPCKEQGVLILQGANNIRVERNVIHSVQTAVHAYQAHHPISIDRNFIYGVRGPFPAGQAITMHTVTSGSGRSKLTCNVSDKNHGSGTKAYVDHFSIYKSSGSSGNPIEIAYNRIRGGTHKSGSGMMLADGGGGHIWAHHNTVVQAANVGIGVAGGSNILIENNRVDQRGPNAASQTFNAFSVRGFSSCSNITLRNNRGIARLWIWNGTGETVSGYGSDGRCSNVGLSGNAWGDTSLSSAIFDEVPNECR